MSKGRKRESDPFADIREWQDHRLDPGYFTGGRIHPVLKGKRPNRYGYILLFFGMFLIFMLGGIIRAGETWMILGTAVAGIANIAGGLALLRKGSAGRKRKGRLRDDTDVA
jgi:hypothetical protein